MKDSKLNRRNFLKTSAIGAASLSLLANSATKTKAATENIVLPSSISERRIIPLNNRWLYSEKSSPEALQTSFNDKAFERVTIPHTNKRLPVSGFDEKEYMFVSVYRRHFKLPAELKGKRIFVDFGGVMTAAKVYLNGQNLGEYRGGYTPFSFELTKNINWNGDNVLAVEVDSTERADIPPFGGIVDYLTFGGIYRDVSLRVVSYNFIENVFAKPVNVLQNNRSVNVQVFLSDFIYNGREYEIAVELLDGEKVLAKQNQKVAFLLSNVTASRPIISLENLGEIELWDINKPKLYNVRVTFSEVGKIIDHYETRIGFREAKFTPEGFFLNGKHLKLRGLNRHQTFPFAGQAMPARVQRRDAWILRKELKCNIVRTSHYPQSPHFLDACDEYGLLVLEEIPGWQHIGDQAWKDLSVQYVETMIRRDWNHPSIILWGVRVNESGDDHDFYTRTNKLAHELDDTRQTGGIRYRYDSEFLEDVYTMNDFGFPLRPPNHPLYLNTEFNGHMYPTKRADNVERVREHTHRHARVHDQLASDAKYAGGLGWCAFDYNTHGYFGSGDRICYHGVSDIFRIPKPAAGFYKSQCDPSEEIVLEPAFDWARGDENETFTNALVCSNCEKLRFYIGERMVAEVEPDRKTYPSLKYAPFSTNLHDGISKGWEDLRIEGYLGGKKVIEKKMSAQGVEKQFTLAADDSELIADGIDATRVVFRVTDEFGNVQPFAHAAIVFSIENGEIIGDNPFALVGGVGAIWIKSTEKAGTIRLTAKHARLGTKVIEINAKAALVNTI
ncbi:MAG: glycoside hydrolase family 2 TIM barrel-domain containing protein [Actinomycetota bacterium]